MCDAALRLMMVGSPTRLGNANMVKESATSDHVAITPGCRPHKETRAVWNSLNLRANGN